MQSIRTKCLNKRKRETDRISRHLLISCVTTTNDKRQNVVYPLVFPLLSFSHSERNEKYIISEILSAMSYSFEYVCIDKPFRNNIIVRWFFIYFFFFIVKCTARTKSLTINLLFEQTHRDEKKIVMIKWKTHIIWFDNWMLALLSFVWRKPYQ